MVVAATGDSYFKLSNEIATSAGKSKFCTHAGDTKRLLSAHFQRLLLPTHANSDDNHTVSAHEEQRVHEGGLRVWTAQDTECVLEVG